MKTVEFVIGEFKDGRLMFLLLFRDRKNFRIYRQGNITYYTWCPTEEDLSMAGRIYKAVDLFNSLSRKKLNERQAVKQVLDLKPFYT